MNALTKEQVQKAKELVSKDPMVENILTALALRKRDRDKVDLYRFGVKLQKQVNGFEEDKYLKGWKKLESLGLGSIIYGRKNKKPTIFKPGYSLKETGRSVIEGKYNPETRNRGPNKKKIERKTPVKKKVVPVYDAAEMNKDSIAQLLIIPTIKVADQKTGLEFELKFDNSHSLANFLKSVG